MGVLAKSSCLALAAEAMAKSVLFNGDAHPLTDKRRNYRGASYGTEQAAQLSNHIESQKRIQRFLRFCGCP
jgi:hypothetical protein